MMKLCASGLLTWHLLAGLLLGGIVAPIILREWDAYRDRVHVQEQRGKPVIRAVGEIVEQTSDYVVIIARGEKLRDCKQPSIQAFTLDASGVMAVARISRITDGSSKLVPRPLGPFVSGPWKVWPLSRDAAKVRIYVLADCDGVEVRNTLAEVSLHVSG